MPKIISTGKIIEKDGWYSVPLVLDDDTAGIRITKEKSHAEELVIGKTVSYTRQEKQTYPPNKGAMKYVGLKVEEGSPKYNGIKALRKIGLGKVFFIDIETTRKLKKLPKSKKDPTYLCWKYKKKEELAEKIDFLQMLSNLSTDMEVNDSTFSYNFLNDLYCKKAALYPAFNQICAITLGYLSEGGSKIILKTMYGKDEKKILEDFTSYVNKIGSKDVRFCGHFIKGFDIPTIYKKLISYGIPVPDLIDSSNSKPWELVHIDIGEFWKTTSPFHESLVEICLSLGISSPKDEIDGSQVSDMFHSNKKDSLETIARYCEKDVEAAANIFLKLKYLPQISEKEVR